MGRNVKCNRNYVNDFGEVEKSRDEHDIPIKRSCLSLCVKSS